MVDAAREIRRAVDTGKVVFGQKSAEKSILKGKGELIVIGKNAPESVKERIKEYAGIAGVPVHEFNGTASELGSVCGKPFTATVMVILDKGKSRVMDLVKKK